MTANRDQQLGQLQHALALLATDVRLLEEVARTAQTHEAREEAMARIRATEQVADEARANILRLGLGGEIN